MLSILFNYVKGHLHGGLGGGGSTDSLLLLNDFQLALVRLCNSEGAGGAGVTDSPGVRIERTEEKNPGSEEPRFPGLRQKSVLKTVTANSEPWERAEIRRGKQVVVAIAIPWINIALKEGLCSRGFEVVRGRERNG